MPGSEVASAPSLGRANFPIPRIWLKLTVPSAPETAQQLVEAADQAGFVIDFSVQPALFGGQLRAKKALTSTTVGRMVLQATTAEEAADYLQAEIIQHLSALGSPTVDFLFLDVRKPFEEFQAEGALMTLEGCRQDGLFRALGMNSSGSALTALGFWSLRDAFDIVAAPLNPVNRSLDQLRSLAIQRRVDLLQTDVLHWDMPFSVAEFFPPAERDSAAQTLIAAALANGPALLPAASVRDVELTAEALQTSNRQSADQITSRALEYINDSESWQRLAQTNKPFISPFAVKRLNSFNRQEGADIG